MSTHSGYVTIICDECGCKKETPDEHVAVARNYAEMAGWNVERTNDFSRDSSDPEGKDYCPSCVRKIICRFREEHPLAGGKA